MGRCEEGKMGRWEVDLREKRLFYSYRQESKYDNSSIAIAGMLTEVTLTLTLTLGISADFYMSMSIVCHWGRIMMDPVE